jgi:ornithine decarboxylase
LRYGPAEAAATVGALAAASATAALGMPAATAFAGALGETLAFYAVILFRALRRSGTPRRQMLTGLLVEFGPAEIADTFAVRPLAMYLGPLLIGHLAEGILAGKLAADVVFYASAIAGYELCKAATTRRDDPFAPDALDRLRHHTPYLLMDLGRVSAAYRTLADALLVDAIHYAVKCNPDRRVLAALHAQGCRFEVASFPELAVLMSIGVKPADVLFSNPVKPPGHVADAHRAGCWRFAADAPTELDKLVAYAPGSAVYVRLRTASAASGVLSEGKFGIDVEAAYALLIMAAERGLRPYGLMFHVGSQMTTPSAWTDAIGEAGVLMDKLAVAGIRLEMLDIGGGFPARYTDPVPHPSAFGSVIREALDRLPYRPRVVAEPGRALVAEAGVLITTVIGTAERGGQDWVHLDVGAFNGLMEALETGNTLAYPLTDSRHCADGRAQLTGPSCDSQDTIMYDAPLSTGLMCGDHVYVGSAGAYTTAYASSFNGFDVPTVRCVSEPDRKGRPLNLDTHVFRGG